jgi:phosphatidylserine/phosphatidylglycerophosphate/cardiolipin synthase-like enzyme
MAAILRRRGLLSVVLLILLGWSLTACGSRANLPVSTDSSLAVYFNDPLAGLPLMNNLPAQANGLDTALITLIDSATRSIDVAVYSVSAAEIIQSLGQACARGVRVRLLIEAETFHGQTYPSCVELELDGNSRSMHDKFAIVDRMIVWTGSTNWSPSGIYFYANNAIEIHDRAVAEVYEKEFEQMFVAKKFGPSKADINPERFQVSHVTLEVYFSPEDRPEVILRQLIARAMTTIEIAMYAVTEKALSQALMEAQARGVDVRAIWDFTGPRDCQSSEVDDLLKAGIGVLDANPGLLHDKYAIIDNKTVITGSANWSASGLGTSPSGANDEDLIIIHSPDIAARYHENFAKLYQDAQRYEAEAQSPPRVAIEEFDTAGNDTALVTWRPHQTNPIDSYEICRANSSDGPCEQSFTLPGSRWYFVDRGLASGRSYFYRVRSASAGQWTDYSNVYEASVRDDIPLLSAEDAKDPQYQGKAVTVRFAVVNKPEPKGQAGNIYLDSNEDYNSNFSGFIPGCAVPHFNGSGLDLLALQGRTVELTGDLEKYKEKPEIIVTEPWQIQCLDCSDSSPH